MPQTKNDGLIHVSLRLWSNDTALGAIIAAAEWNIDHLHLRGEIVDAQGSRPGRRAKRHYTAVESVSLDAQEALSLWLNRMVEQIHHQQILIAGLISGQIEGIIWIALFDDDTGANAIFDARTLAEIATCHIRVLIENYTDFDEDGVPRKTWLS